MRKIALLFATACSSSTAGVADELVGTYRTVHMAENQAGCDQPLADVAIDAGELFFRLDTDSLFGAHYLAWHRCREPGACDDAVVITRSFSDEAGGWRLETPLAVQIGASCELGVTESVPEATATGIRITSRHLGTTFAVTPEDSGACQADRVDEHRAELVCDRIAVREADLE